MKVRFCEWMPVNYHSKFILIILCLIYYNFAGVVFNNSPTPWHPATINYSSYVRDLNLIWGLNIWTACSNYTGTYADIRSTLCSIRLEWCVEGMFELIYPQIFITSITVRKCTLLNVSRHITYWWLISFIMITCINSGCCRRVRPQKMYEIHKNITIAYWLQFTEQ